MELEQLKQFLNEVGKLSEISNRLRMEKRSRGDAFNIFTELGLTTDEVKLHSSFVAMLLNPDATHGQGDIFLKTFIEMLEEKRNPGQLPLYLDTPNTVVKVEKDIGAVKGEHGGRIDIYMADNNGYFVIIENKIYAGDQENQMKRYWNFAQEKSKNNSNKYRLVYLTLDGHDPSKDSKNDLESNEYICLSYKNDIVTWLNKCLGLTIRQPLLRETINQYIDTLKQLTYSDMDNSKEVLKIMSKKENLDAAFVIAGNINEMISNVINTDLLTQLESIAKSKGLELEFKPRNNWMTDSWAGWNFKHPDWNNYQIRMEFEKRGLDDLIIGFVKKGDNQKNKCWEDLLERMKSFKHNQSWVWGSFPQAEFRCWNKPESIKAIMDGQTMMKYISDAIDELMEYTKDIEHL